MIPLPLSLSQHEKAEIQGIAKLPVTLLTLHKSLLKELKGTIGKISQIFQMSSTPCPPPKRKQKQKNKRKEKLTKIIMKNVL